MIYCEIRDGVVVNRIVFEGEMPNDWPGFEAFVQSDEAQIGWAFDGKSFTAPPEPEAPQAPAPQPDPLDQLRALLATYPDLIKRLTE